MKNELTEDRRQRLRSLRYIVEATVFASVPVALAVDESSSVVYLVGAVVTTAAYAVVGWLLQPLLTRGTVGTSIWLAPLALLGVAGLAMMNSFALGPVMVYFIASDARNNGVSSRDLIPANLQEYACLVLAIFPAILIFLLNAHSEVFQGVVSRIIWRIVTRQSEF